MQTNPITVVYKWTAKPGQFETLKQIYRGVTDAMKANEPGALDVQVFASEEDQSLHVRDEFADADALGFHLGETAAPHFPKLLDIATPGTFYFFGNVPDAMQNAARAMGLNAEFSTHMDGFHR